MPAKSKMTPAASKMQSSFDKMKREGIVCKSMTLPGMRDIVKKLNQMCVTMKVTTENESLTSKHIQSLLTSKHFGFGEKGQYLYKINDFKPFFQDKHPMVALTYTWSSTLQDVLTLLETQVTQYALEYGLEKDEVTFWMDIFHVDQNSENIKGEVDSARWIYQYALFHVVILLGAPMHRVWCALEFFYRWDAVKRSNGELSPTVYLGSDSSNLGDFIAKEGDYYRNMTSYSAEDRQEIQRTLRKMVSSISELNVILSRLSEECYRSVYKDFSKEDEAWFHYDNGPMSRITSPRFWQYSPRSDNDGVCEFCNREKKVHVHRNPESSLLHCFFEDEGDDEPALPLAPMTTSFLNKRDKLPLVVQLVFLEFWKIIRNSPETPDQRFDQIDVDQDGRISRLDMMMFVASQGSLGYRVFTNDDIFAVFKCVDPEDTFYLSRDDFLHLLFWAAESSESSEGLQIEGDDQALSGNNLVMVRSKDFKLFH